MFRSNEEASARQESRKLKRAAGLVSSEGGGWKEDEHRPHVRHQPPRSRRQSLKTALTATYSRLKPPHLHLHSDQLHVWAELETGQEDSGMDAMETVEAPPLQNSSVRAR